MDKLRLHRQQEQCSKALQSALLNWGKADMAAAWLERDFDLVYAQLIAHSALLTLIHARDDIKARLGQSHNAQLSLVRRNSIVCTLTNFTSGAAFLCG